MSARRTKPGAAPPVPVDVAPATRSEAITIRTSLANWSDLNGLTGRIEARAHELRLAAGYALARCMDGNEPTPDQVAAIGHGLRELAIQLTCAGDKLRDAVAMKTGRQTPKDDLGSFRGAP